MLPSLIGTKLIKTDQTVNKTDQIVNRNDQIVHKNDQWSGNLTAAGTTTVECFSFSDFCLQRVTLIFQ